MDIELTGNPFVDTGLGVIAYLAGCKNIHSLKLNHLIEVHQDGRALARKNLKMKSMTMIFSNNSLATNPAIDPKKRLQYYSILTTAILKSIGKEDLIERCESCGNNRSLDIYHLVRKTLVPLGLEDSARYLGRDWFPLTGSMGSDAQALPAASRGPNICAKCLFAVHYLPLGVILVNGRLAIFQSTFTVFWFDLVQEIANEIDNRVRVTSAEAIDTLGKSEGSSSAIRRLFKIMKDMKEDDLGPEVRLFVWLFSNSGPAPDCSIEEIPNYALQFMQNSSRVVAFKEIEVLLNGDRKRRPDFSLLGCISRRDDYHALYPRGEYDGVSNELFATYQVIVRDIPISRLHIAHRIANYVKEAIGDSKQLQILKKDIDRKPSARSTVRRIVADMIQKGLLTYDDYSSLFLVLPHQYLKESFDAWKFLKFYLSKGSVRFPTTLEKRVNVMNASSSIQDQKPDYRMRLQYVAVKVFEMFSKEKGRENIPGLISSIARKAIKPAWLQMQFIKLADKYQGFTYRDWLALCTGEDGRDISWAVLAQLRLIWSEWAGHGPLMIPNTISSKVDRYATEVISNSNSMHTEEYEQLALKIVDNYLKRYGEAKLRKYVFEGLKTRRLGLNWFREQLLQIDPKFEDDYHWEMFLQDEDGKSIPLTRLFQLHLSMRNSLRHYLFKNEQVLAK